MNAPASHIDAWAGMLRGLLQGLPRPAAAIVHLGAGASTELPIYRETDAASILLVEADPEAAAELAERSQAEPRIEVQHEVISADTEPRPFFQANLPELSSLRPPHALRALFPGLRILSQKPVTPMDPVALLKGRWKEKGGRLLVLETPGETAGILEALEAAGMLQRFDAVALREWREPFYDGGAPLAACRTRLEEAGYLVEAELSPEDPDRPWLAARLNRATLERLRAAETRIAELTEERDAARRALETQSAALEKAQERASERRLERLRDELLKAEGQITLLRDLLVDGPGL